MINLIAWALLTGLVTGGVWMGIIVFRHQRELESYEPDQISDIERRLGELERAQARIAELEERLDFAERMLTAAHPPDALPREKMN